MNQTLPQLLLDLVATVPPRAAPLAAVVVELDEVRSVPEWMRQPLAAALWARAPFGCLTADRRAGEAMLAFRRAIRAAPADGVQTPAPAALVEAHEALKSLGIKEEAVEALAFLVEQAQLACADAIIQEARYGPQR